MGEILSVRNFHCNWLRLISQTWMFFSATHNSSLNLMLWMWEKASGVNLWTPPLRLLWLWAVGFFTVCWHDTFIFFCYSSISFPCLFLHTHFIVIISQPICVWESVRLCQCVYLQTGPQGHHQIVNLVWVHLSWCWCLQQVDWLVLTVHTHTQTYTKHQPEKQSKPFVRWYLTTWNKNLKFLLKLWDWD